MLYDDIKALYEFADSDVKRIGLGIPDIDELIRGPAPGEVCMVIGRSYAGKSIIGQNIVLNHKELPSLFFSMEMPRMQAIIRLYSMWSDTPATQVQMSIEEGTPPEDIWDMATAFPLHKIDDRSGLTVEDMSRAIMDYEHSYKMRPAFVLLDYLELMGGAKASGDGYIATERQATQLKDWAKEEELPVFVLHQTNKQEKPWMPPTPDSARNGGFTEADFVIGLWRPHKNPEMNFLDKMANSHVIAANVIKNRAFFEEKDRIDLHIEPSLRVWRPKERIDTITY